MCARWDFGVIQQSSSYSLVQISWLSFYLLLLCYTTYFIHALKNQPTVSDAAVFCFSAIAAGSPRRNNAEEEQLLLKALSVLCVLKHSELKAL